MLSLISTLGGILLGGLPKLLDYFQSKQDHKHELELARVQTEREKELAALGFAAQANVEEIRSDQIAMQTEAARNLVYKAAGMVDAGVSLEQLASIAAMSKCFATDTAMKVATDAVQLFGAAGISNEYPINRYFRDAKVLQIVEGTNQIQRNIIADRMLGRAAR